MKVNAKFRYISPRMIAMCLMTLSAGIALMSSCKSPSGPTDSSALNSVTTYLYNAPVGDSLVFQVLYVMTDTLGHLDTIFIQLDHFRLADTAYVDAEGRRGSLLVQDDLNLQDSITLVVKGGELFASWTAFSVPELRLKSPITEGGIIAVDSGDTTRIDSVAASILTPFGTLNAVESTRQYATGLASDVDSTRSLSEYFVSGRGVVAWVWRWKAVTRSTGRVRDRALKLLLVSATH